MIIEEFIDVTSYIVDIEFFMCVDILRENKDVDVEFFMCIDILRENLLVNKDEEKSQKRKASLNIST